jgi:rhamnosyltransferase
VPGPPATEVAGRGSYRDGQPDMGSTAGRAQAPGGPSGVDRSAPSGLVQSLGEVWAVTVTYNPILSDGRLERQLATVAKERIAHVIVDNGSRNLEAIRELARRYHRPDLPVEVYALQANLGIARALNDGVRRCLELGHPAWILTLDQDTCFPPEAFPLASRELSRITITETVGIISFNYHERVFGEEHPYNRLAGPAEIRSIITSGNFVSARALEVVRYDDDFFLYFVDVEFCHRLRSLGFKIWVFRQAFIDHQEGSQLKRGNRRSSYLDPPRLYFVARNGMHVFRRHASLKALAVVVYLVLRNCFNGVDPGRSLRFASRGSLATAFPNRFPPPVMP